MTGSTRNRIDQVAAAVGVALTYAGSDRNAADLLAAGAGVSVSYAGSDANYVELVATAIDEAGPELPVGYALDDNGDLATGMGYGYAGPAVGSDSQSMDYTAAVDGAAVLLPAGILTTARFPRRADASIAVEAVVTETDETCGGSLIVVISDAGGNVINVASVNGTNGALDTLAAIVATDGTVTAVINEVPRESPEWLFDGPKLVGATDMVGFGLAANTYTVTGNHVAMTLRTDAADITGDYGVGATDPWGNPIGGA